MAKQRRGRDRREKILAAARDVFVERGYEAATLDEVIARAGGSRATIYEEFGGKQGLFAAIIADVCEQISLPLQSEEPPRRALLAFAQAYMTALMRPQNIGLYRLVIAEGARVPALAQKVFDAGPEMATRAIAGTLRRNLGLSEADRAARIFLEMVKGDLHSRALFGIDQPSAREIDRTVRAAVTIFCDGLGL
jgi:AcrR family transcriptional regulator